MIVQGMRITMIAYFNAFRGLQAVPCYILIVACINMFTNNKKCNRDLFIFYNVQYISCAFIRPVIKRQVNFFLFLFNRRSYLYGFFFGFIVFWSMFHFYPSFLYRFSACNEINNN